MDQPLDPGHQLDKGSVVGDTDYATGNAVSGLIFGGHLFPGIGRELLEPQRHPFLLGHVLEHLER